MFLLLTLAVCALFPMFLLGWLCGNHDKREELEAEQMQRVDWYRRAEVAAYRPYLIQHATRLGAASQKVDVSVN